MPDILDQIDEAIAGWEDNRDAARWSPDPQVMDAIEDARFGFLMPIVDGEIRALIRGDGFVSLTDFDGNPIETCYHRSADGDISLRNLSTCTDCTTS